MTTAMATMKDEMNSTTLEQDSSAYPSRAFYRLKQQ